MQGAGIHVQDIRQVEHERPRRIGDYTLDFHELVHGGKKSGGGLFE